MIRRPALPQTLAALLWVTTIVTAVTGFDEDRSGFSSLDQRLWCCMLAASVVTTVLAGQRHMAAKAARIYAETTKAAVTRPPYAAPPSGPLARMVTTGPLAKLVALPGTHHGQHARQSR